MRAGRGAAGAGAGAGATQRGAAAPDGVGGRHGAAGGPTGAHRLRSGAGEAGSHGSRMHSAGASGRRAGRGRSGRRRGCGCLVKCCWCFVTTLLRPSPRPAFRLCPPPAQGPCPWSSIPHTSGHHPISQTGWNRCSISLSRAHACLIYLCLLSQPYFASVGQASARIIASLTWSLFMSPLTHRLVLLCVDAYCFIFWDVPGNVLAAPASALCGWIGVTLLSPSHSLSPRGPNNTACAHVATPGLAPRMQHSRRCLCPVVFYTSVDRAHM